MRVELLYWDGDPGYMTARQRLVEVLNEDAFETTIQMIAVSTEEDAELLDFRGSPTIRIDGREISDAPPPAGGGRLRRRTYPVEERPESTDAGPGDDAERHLPSKRLIRAAVERARGWSHGRR